MYDVKPWKTSRLRRFKLAIVGFGDIGERILQQIPKQISVLAVGRSPATTPKHCQSTRFLTLDLDDVRSAQKLQAIGHHVIYLAPPPTQPTDLTTDPRIKHFLAYARHVKRCVYISTTGVYGKAQSKWVVETSPVNPSHSRGKRRAHAEQCVRGSSIPHTTILRVPGIYAFDSTSKRLPIERIVSGLPALIEADDVPTNHIHADDLAKLCWLALFKAKNRRVYNATDNEPTLHAQYLTLVAQHFKLPTPPKHPRDYVKQSLSSIAWSMLADGRRVSNERLLQEWGIRLRYPSVQSFLHTLSATAATA